MGSLPYVLQVVLPRSGAVPPNSAIVLQGHVVGPLVVTARAAGADVGVALEPAPEFGPRAPGTFRMWLVRPATGDWPAGGTVVLTAVREPQEPAVLEVPIAMARDLTAPALSSVSLPQTQTFSGPRQPSWEAVVCAHRGFADAESPLVVVTLEVGGSVLTGSALEGLAGYLPLPPGPVQPLDAITLTDLAGNAVRTAQPCTDARVAELPSEPVPVESVAEPPSEPAPSEPLAEPPSEPGRSEPNATTAAFACVAGTLATENGWFVGTTDAGTENGFSRGHYRASASTAGDIEIAVTAARLTDDHAMPIEVAFRGGFFGVTGTSLFYLYETDANWTGWKATPVAVEPGPVELRVTQRGAEVEGFVNGMLAGSLTLQRPSAEGPVGVFFKGPPGQQARMRFRDFTVQPLPPAGVPSVAPPQVALPVGRLVWGGYDVGAGDPHPEGAANPSGEPWDFAVLATEDDHTVLARVWTGSIDTRVIADFWFDDALHGRQDAAVLPLLVEGFFGDDGHTLGYYRNPDRFSHVRFTNLRTGASWSCHWDSLDEAVAEMMASPAFVPRDMR
ncbi:MAG: hypothetical protein R3B40_13590 [Polyangiales bacterium]|nr:hypothetical protein [Sandaracinaceae bacterium]